jgi:uncharacterized protein YbjT (DUF2867 family)
VILVLGGTGRLGRETVKLLSTSGRHKVRVLVRDPAKAAAFPGVEIVTGEMTDADSLAQAMRGIKRVFAIPPNIREQSEMESCIYRAARRAAVSHIVKLSTVKANVHSPCHFFQQHAIAEESLKTSGVAFTILRSNSFMQNLLWFAKEIKSESRFSLPMGAAKTAPVDVRDVAAVASAILTGEAQHDVTHNISGPEKLSFAEIADRLSAVIGKRIEYRDIVPAEFLNMLVRSGIPGWYAEAVTASWTVARQGEPILTDSVSALAKKSPITFEQFARDYADKFMDDRR